MCQKRVRDLCTLPCGPCGDPMINEGDLDPQVEMSYTQAGCIRGEDTSWPQVAPS
jgi:hypothetical protein